MSSCIFVISKENIPLMPTFNWKKVRRLLKTGRAIIIGHEPFTIKLCYDTTNSTQPIEACEDTGDRHIGLCIKSEKHVYVSKQYDHLKNETEHYNDCRKYRRARRNRLRYRKPRFNNRRRDQNNDDKWFAPSIKNKELNHLRILQKYSKVCPINDIWLECGSFDTQALTAIEAGQPVPKSTDYQHGSRYGFDTLREAVFYRDNYSCICCNKGIKENKILRTHHLGFKTGDRTNRLNNLTTVCTTCHTPTAHRPGGKLYELSPKLKPFKSAGFMTSVRFQLVKDAKDLFPDTTVHMCYGASTKRERLSRRIAKSHTNDAYCIGLYRPKHKTKTLYYQKRRRNNRILEKFYDAVYIDIRDNNKHKGSELGCNRTNRRELRNNPQNFRVYHGIKTSKGRRSIRQNRYQIQNGDICLYKNKKYTVSGTMHYGTYVKLKDGPDCIKVNKIKVIRHQNAWVQISGKEAAG